jgi:hypothetical protein
MLDSCQLFELGLPCAGPEVVQFTIAAVVPAKRQHLFI